MKCFMKWGHKWEKPSTKLEKEIKERLDLIGVFPQTMEVCPKCQRIKLKAITLMSNKPKTVIMPAIEVVVRVE